MKVLILLLGLVSAGVTVDAVGVDWLVQRVNVPVTVKPFVDATLNVSGICLSNGLISRSFALSPAFGTVSLKELQAFDDPSEGVRTVQPYEALITLDGKQYPVGGLTQSTVGDFKGFQEPPLHFSANPDAFQYVGYSTSAPTASTPWTPGMRGSPKTVAWPPRGLRLTVVFSAPSTASPSLKGVNVSVVFEMYEEMPVTSKWVEVSAPAGTSTPPVVDAVIVEQLGLNSAWGAYLTHGSSPPGSGLFASNGAPATFLQVVTDEAHGTECKWADGNVQVPGQPMPDYGAMEPVLKCTYGVGPGVHLEAGGVWTSFRTIILVMDSWDVQRQALGRGRMIGELAPWVWENPLFLHLTDVTHKGVVAAVDQLVEVGFEMVLFSFGSGFNFESTDPIYRKEVADSVAYAKSKGIEVSGYDLVVLERGHGGYGGNVGDKWDALDASGKPTENACIASGWYDKLSDLLFGFMNATGIVGLEADGPYGGSTCYATDHAHHAGYNDSVYQQTKMQNAIFTEIRALGGYIHQALPSPTLVEHLSDLCAA